ncbi:MAG TPA: hypothetical protein VFW86_05620, partial [Candidatus Limnocylindrales bacterium]|nr:hypothetical protein [Candidatus Limnocylindrales bacterium]
ATLENGAFDDARRGHLSTEEAIDHLRRSGAARGLLVHYASERRDAIAALCAASGLPIEPARSGMTIEVGPGRAAGRGADQETVRTG